MAAPEIDDLFAVEVEADPGADLLAVGEALLEDVAHHREARVAVALDDSHARSSRFGGMFAERPVQANFAIVATSRFTTFSTFCSKIATIWSQVTGSSSSFQQS